MNQDQKIALKRAYAAIGVKLARELEGQEVDLGRHGMFYSKNDVLSKISEIRVLKRLVSVCLSERQR